jgi:hypothetical protein
MNGISAKHFVDAEFPNVMRAHIPAALKTAYRAVEALYETTPLLQTVSAQVGKGHVIGWAVDHEFARLVDSGKLPSIKYRWVSYVRPTGRYLLLQLPASTMSISQLPEPAALPRHAYFRQNHVLNNAPFLNLPGFEEETRISGLPHLILAHGYQALSFAHIGVPHPEPRRHGWIYRTPNLLTMPHIVESEEPKVEAADAEAVVTLRDELNRWIRDHANDA